MDRTPMVNGLKHVSMMWINVFTWTYSANLLNVISTDDFIDRGLEAYNNVPQAVNGINPQTGRAQGVLTTAFDNSGKEWNFYIRDNKLITMYTSL